MPCQGCHCRPGQRGMSYADAAPGRGGSTHLECYCRCHHTQAKDGVRALAASLVAAELEKSPIDVCDPLYKMKMGVVVRKCVEDAKQAVWAVDEFMGSP